MSDFYIYSINNVIKINLKLLKLYIRLYINCDQKVIYLNITILLKYYQVFYKIIKLINNAKLNIEDV